MVARGRGAGSRFVRTVVSALAVAVVAAGQLPSAGATVRVAPAAATSAQVISLACGSVHRGLRLRDSHDVTVTTRGTCGPAVIDPSRAVTGWHRIGPGRWRAALGFAPGQVIAGGRLLELAHTARHGTNPWTKVRDATADGLTLPGLDACADLTGATVRVRTSLYEINEGPVTASTGNRLSVAGFGGATGWGAYVEGPGCLLDEPGEWFWHDGNLDVRSATKPSAVRAARPAAVGIDARGSTGLTVTGVAVRNAVTGLDLSSSYGARLSGVQVELASQFGIDAGCASHLSLTHTSVRSTGRDGLMVGYCGDHVSVRHSEFRHIGTVLMPRKSDAAIFGGFTRGMRIVDNVVRDTQYIGIRVYTHAQVTDNLVVGTCRILEDCGGIYMFDREHQGLSSVVSNNVVRGCLGNAQGRETASGQWWVHGLAAGIYLDDGSDLVTVSHNTVSRADYGLLLHQAVDNQISSNTWTSARRGYVLFGDDLADPVMTGNVFARNRFGPTDHPVYVVQSEFGRERTLAVFRDNRYPSAHPFALLGSYGEVGLPRWRRLVDDT